MPYEVKKLSSCPASKPWAVVKQGTSKSLGCHPTKKAANAQMAALYAQEPSAASLPALVTIGGVELVAAGTWQLSTGEQTFTPEDLASAVEAAGCPAVGDPVIKLGHTDARFNTGDGQPAIGHVTNMALASGGMKITGDLAGMPGWLGVVSGSAYPKRSIEGYYGFPCQIGHVHPFVITAVALLGASPPGVGVLESLEDIAELYGVAAAKSTPAAAWRIEIGGAMTGQPMAAGVTSEDVRRSYYEQSQAPYSMWVSVIMLDPPQIIVCDDSTDKMFRVPVKIKNGEVSFGDAVEVEVEYADVPAVAAAAASVGCKIAATFDTAEAGRAGYAEPDDDPPAPPDPVEAGKHGPFTGTHSHPHGAYGAQGGDQTHDHAHTHSGDAMHSHAHAGAGATKKEGSDVDFTDEQKTAMRAKLGLAEDAELTAEQIFAAMTAEAPPAPVSAGSGKLPDGAVLIDKDVWEETQAQIRQGVQANAKMQKSERDAALEKAISAGKFRRDRLEHWQRVWDADPASAKEVIAGLTPGAAVPVNAVGQPGGDMDDEEFYADYAQLFPAEYKASNPLGKA